MVVYLSVRLVVLGITCVVLEVPAAQAAVADNADSPLAKLHPALERLLEETNGPVTAWVFFTDKGVHSKAAYAQAIERLTSSYNPRAVRRRMLRRTAPGLFDERDIPVPDAYVDAVAHSGACLRVKSRWLNAVSVLATRSQLAAISRLPFVRSVEPVRRTRVPGARQAAAAPTHDGWTASTGDFYGRSEDQLTQINLIELHEAGFTGAGVVIGVLDTGFRKTHEVFNHPDHPLQVVAEWDFVQDDPDTQNEPGDSTHQHDHGTFILGTLAAYLPGELVGAAYDASYILCKVEEVPEEYNGEEDLFVAGLEFIEANGGDVATSSVVIYVGYTQDDLDGLTTVMTTGINVATANGLHVCQGAGNEGHDTNPITSHLVPPADAFDAITVGAVQSNGTIASFSSDGPTADGRVKPEVLSRGVSVWTVSADSDTDYTTQGGTSLATPQVCGAVACLLQAQPDWTVEQMRLFLSKTADYYVAHYRYDYSFVHGYGVINAFRALFNDCNANGVIDADDLAAGTSHDYNGNDHPDECDLPGDFNGDDALDLGDFSRFVTCIGGPAYPITDGCLVGDADSDARVDLRDFGAVQNAFTD